MVVENSGGQINQALLHLIGSLEGGEVGGEQVLRRHERNHLGAEVHGVEIGLVGRRRSGAGDVGGRVLDLSGGLVQSLKSDRGDIHLYFYRQ